MNKERAEHVLSLFEDGYCAKCNEFNCLYGSTQEVVNFIKELQDRINKAIKILEQDGNEYESEQHICEAIFILKGEDNE